MIIHKAFGLDLGTTNSTASIVKNNKVIYAEEGRERTKTIPSIVAIKRNGEEVVGSLAKNEFYAGNPNSKKSVKREMGKVSLTEFGDKKLSPEEISSKIIKYCKECLEKTIDKEENVVYDRVVITVPAYFTLAQKNATLQAAKLCGLNVEMLLEEPTAAAVNFAIQNDIENGLFFVIDLGGGTFDVSILEKIENIPSVLAIAGNSFLGGDNFDYILARHFLDILKENGNNINDIEVDEKNRKFRLLLFAAENVKKRLSVEDNISIYVPDIFRDNTGVELIIDEFTRDEFNELIKEKVEIDIISECEKALKTLEENYEKTLDDITHIIMVGGSTKIPFVQKVIKDKYCVTDKLKDLTIFQSDLSVSAGAAYVANTSGIKLENDKKDILINVNSPYCIDEYKYISGKLEKGNVKKIGIVDGSNEEVVEIGDDGEFLITVDKNKFSDEFTYNFYDENGLIENVVNNDGSTVDIIAPTPVQNEDIAIEIIDIEKGKIEKYNILPYGTFLPSETKEYFKLNEYSTERVVLPVWEGSRKIFNFIIDLPEKFEIGSKISVTTCVDVISNIKLKVELDGKQLNGKYEYIKNEEISEEREEKLNNLFKQRVSNIPYEGDVEVVRFKKESFDRELEEAKSNNDENHYANVMQKMEKLVAEMPAFKSITEEDFDELGKIIKEYNREGLNYTDDSIDNLTYHGKRFIQKGNMVEANKCFDELLEIRDFCKVYNNPKDLYYIMKNDIYRTVAIAYEYMSAKGSNSFIVTQIENYLQKTGEKLVNKLKVELPDSTTDEEYKTATSELADLAGGLYVIVGRITGNNDNKFNQYKGLVSKA